MPAPAGAVLAVFILALFVMGYFFQGFGGPAQMLVIALAVAGIVVLIETNENLRGIHLSVARVDPVPAHGEILVRLTLTNLSCRERFGLRVRCRDGFRLVGRSEPVSRVAPGGALALTISLPAGARGIRPLPDVWVSSTFPAGLCFSWKVFRTGARAVVYPHGRSWRDLPGRQQAGGAGDVGGRKPYTRGDPPARIDWKSYARRERLEIRSPDSLPAMHIRWEDTAFLGDTESRLEQLSAWIDACQRERLRFQFSLGTEHGDELSIPACRTALAGFREIGPPAKAQS